MFKQLWRKLTGRNIAGISKRVTRMQNDIDDNIAYNDDLIAEAAKVITALKAAQDKLMAENVTGASMRDSITVMK